MTPQQANELLRNALLRARDWTGHEDNIAVIDQALAATADCAPAPTEPAVDRDAVADMEARKDAAYLERNQVVAALAKAFPSGVARTAIEGWSEDWHGCVYIDLPTGQASWHFHDSHAYLFADLPPYKGEWDGHETAEKYRRLAALATPASPAVQGTRDHLLKIIAFAYQIAGWHDAPEHILDVLADPESATAAQVDAMLPYQVVASPAVPGHSKFGSSELQKIIISKAMQQVAQASQPTSAEGKDSERLEGGTALYAALRALVESLAQNDEEGLIEHAPEMVNARKALSGSAPSPAWNAALDAAADLFPQPYMEYFGDAIQLAIRSLKSSPVPDPCPQCERGGVCKSITCGRLRSSELMAMYGTAPQAPT